MCDKNIATIVMNSVTPKAAAKLKLLFIIPASDVGVLNICVKLK
jgi:hypothetical protein